MNSKTKKTPSRHRFINDNARTERGQIQKEQPSWIAQHLVYFPLMMSLYRMTKYCVGIFEKSTKYRNKNREILLYTYKKESKKRDRPRPMIERERKILLNQLCAPAVQILLTIHNALNPIDKEIRQEIFLFIRPPLFKNNVLDGNIPRANPS